MDAQKREESSKKQRPRGMKSRVTGDQVNQKLYNPVDSGWSWVILSCLFLTMVTCIGFARSFGLLFVGIQQKMYATASMVSLIAGIQGAVFSIAGWLTMTFLIDLMSARALLVLGGLIGSVGIALSFFADSILFLVFSQSVCSGVGLSLILGPSFVLLSNYFVKRRPLAVTIGYTGGSVGAFVMPFITRMFLEEYGLSGTYLLLGGIFAQVIVLALFCTPPTDYRPKRRVSDCSGEDHVGQRLLQSAPDGGESGRLEKSASGTIRSENDANESKEQTRKDAVHTDDEHTNRSTAKFHSDNNHDENDAADLHSISYHRPRALSDPQSRSPAERKIDRSKARTSMNEERPNVVIEMRDDLCHSGELSLAAESSESTRSQNHLVSSQNVSVPASTCDPLYFSSNEIIAYDVVSDDVVSKTQSCMGRCCSKTFDISLFKNPLFCIILLCNFFGVIGNGIPVALLPPFAVEKGLTITEGALLVTISGALDIVSRLVPGFIVQLKWLKPQTMLSIAFLVQGVVFQFTAMFDSLPLMVLLAVVYGICVGVSPSMMQLIIIDFVGIHRFPKAYGFTQLILGMSVAMFFPFLGYIRDVSGSYVLPFHVIGVCLFISGACLQLEPLARRLESKMAAEDDVA